MSTFREVDMDQALELRNAQLWAEWVDGASMTTIGERHGLTRWAVSEGIHAYVGSIPPQERAAFRERALARLEALYQDHREAARTSTRAGNLVLRVILGQAHLLGLAPREVKVEHGGAVELGVAHDPGPTVAELLERWRAEGKLRTRAELVRMDGGGG
jgi:hypothetical protein